MCVMAFSVKEAMHFKESKEGYMSEIRKGNGWGNDVILHNNLKN